MRYLFEHRWIKSTENSWPMIYKTKTFSSDISMSSVKTYIDIKDTFRHIRDLSHAICNVDFFTESGREPFHVLATIITTPPEKSNISWLIISRGTQRCPGVNGLTVDAVYPILLLYPPETPVPSLSYLNMLLGSLLCPLASWFLLDSTFKGLHSLKFDVIAARRKWWQI